MANADGKIVVRKPPSIWQRDLKFDFKDVLGITIKAVFSIVAGNPSAAASAGIDVLQKLGLAQDVGALTWLLVARSIGRAVPILIARDSRIVIDSITQAELLTHLESFLGEQEWVLDPIFLTRPASARIVIALAEVLGTWLRSNGTPREAADVAERGFPGEIGAAFSIEWRLNHRVYEPIAIELRHPFAAEGQVEEGWRRYHDFLEAQLNEYVFNEKFALRDIYVPLRALRHRDSIARESIPDLVDAAEELYEWADAAWKTDPLRIISGEPGSGKSSLAKVFAAEQSRRRDLRVLFIPLYLFDLQDSIEHAICAFFANHADVPEPVFDGHSSYILVFDGLDELVMQGENGPKLAAQFLASLDKMLQRAKGGTLLALVSGREVLVDALASLVKRHRVLKLIPFYVSPSIAANDPHGLRFIDQRNTWWALYGALKGRDYAALPEPLQRDELVDISAQPLLNYILALSYERGQIDFAAAPTINTIYHDVIGAVYDHGWGESQHPSVRGIANEVDFERVLQEIALAAWQGNGRTTTATAALARCRKSGVEHLLGDFSAGVQRGLAQLLTAFYFRYRDERLAEDRTFEFTHKSFSEYLLARRLVALATQIASVQVSDGSVGRPLDNWIDVSNVPYDEHVFKFVSNEIALLTPLEREAIRKNALPLLRSAILLNLPLNGPVRENLVAARRSGTALLAVVSGAAAVDEQRVSLDLPTPDDFGQWLNFIVGSRADSIGPICLNSLRGLILDGVRLQGVDAGDCRLDSSRFSRSHWVRSNFANVTMRKAEFSHSRFIDCHGNHADCEGADFTLASFAQGDWSHSSLQRARLVEAKFRGVALSHALLNAADAVSIEFDGCDLRDCQFDGALLTNARFLRCALDGSSFRTANLTRATFKECSGLVSVNFTGCALILTTFPQTDLPKLLLTDFQREQLRHERDVRDTLDHERR
jgi:uncharacterized protein YjbI with pentapeptide repeats